MNYEHIFAILFIFVDLVDPLGKRVTATYSVIIQLHYWKITGHSGKPSELFSLAWTGFTK
jgi:hypothetical protein